jgi:hypothetical protein
MEPSPPRIGYIGLRAKTARAIVVTIAAGDEGPNVVTRGEIVLATPASPELFQPYHAVVDLPWERAAPAVGKAERAIAETAARALKDLVAGLCDAGIAVSGVGVVGAPDRDLAAIASPHIRAHAAEGVLFRRVLETAATANKLPCERYPENDLEMLAASRLDLPVAAIKSRLAQFGKQMGTPWRADEKAAAIAAWLASA